MIIEEYQAKTVIRTSTPSLFSWGEAYLNPYQGCYHDCVYCDGKSEGYYMHDDFAKRIRVKSNSPQLLEQFFKKKGFFPIHREKTSTLVDFLPPLRASAQSHQPGKFIIYIGGGVCDVYQPAEKKIRITRKLLEIVYDYAFPVFILTKNNLALRDLDLLKKINEDSYANVSFTITLANEKTQKIFEPHASTTQERFKAINKFREEGIHSGVYFYPCLPFIGDTEENMKAIYRQAKSAGAEFVYCEGLTLKPGRSKQEFLQTIGKHFPSLLPKYEQLYGNNHKYGHLDVDQFGKLGLVWPQIKGFKLGYEHGLSYTAKRYIPEGQIKPNLQISEILFRIVYVLGTILHGNGNVTQSEIRQLSYTAKFLATFQEDVSKMKEKELEKLSVSKKVYSYISSIFKNKNQILKELEEKAYKLVP